MDAETIELLDELAGKHENMALLQARLQFNPPRVMLVLNKHNPGDLPEDVASNRSCYIDMGREASIHRGDELNVYREVYPMGSCRDRRCACRLER